MGRAILLGMEDEVFDPEKVKRTIGECDFGEGWYDYEVVEASDYDQLLALYRKTADELDRSEGL